MIYGYIIIIMKEQILSRIQSYQNMPIRNGLKNSKNSIERKDQLINQVKFYKYFPNNLKQQLKISNKLSSPPPKLIGQKHYLVLSTVSSNKKKISWQKKKSLHFQPAHLSHGKQGKNQKILQRVSQKYIGQNTSAKLFTKQLLTYGKTEQVYQHNSVPRNKNFSSSLLKEVNKNRRKELLRIYNKYEGNKSIKIGSEQTIKNIDYEHNKDNNYDNCNPVTPMMRTINVYKDYKQSPYFNFSNNNKIIKSAQTIEPSIETKNFHQTLITQKNDISIEISGDNNQFNDESTIMRQNLQFGCSQIKKISMDNDSSFLEPSQKVIIDELEQIYKKEESKKKKWKKLPNDFLKI